MALQHSPSIVTNGLVLCLDPANIKSYPGSGTTISDPSGSKIVELPASVNDASSYNRTISTTNVSSVADAPSGATGYSMVFNSSDLGIPGSSELDVAGDCTFEMWIKYSGAQYWGTLYGSNGSAGTNFGAASGQHNGYKWALDNLVSTSVSNTNTWTHVAWVRSGTATTLYVNGIAEATGTRTGNVGFGVTNFSGRAWAGLFGRGSPPYYPFGDNYVVVRLYSLVISKVARYTANFTPAANLTVDSNTLASIGYRSSFGSVQYTGTLVNSPTYSNNVLTLNGSNQYIDLGSFFTYREFTINLWVKPGSTQVQYADIFDNNHTGNRSFVFQQDSTTTNVYGIGVADASGSISGVTSISLTANTWVNITVTFTPSDRLKVYLNGVFYNQGNLANGREVLYSSQVFSIGRWGGGGRNWNGQISSFTVYNRVLSATEVQQNFNALRGRFNI